MKELKEILREQIDLKKKSAIENIGNENMVPAMWDIAELIDLKSQIKLLDDIECETNQK